MSLPPVSDYKALYEYLVEIGICPPLPVQRTDADPTSWEANDYMSNVPSCQDLITWLDPDFFSISTSLSSTTPLSSPLNGGGNVAAAGMQATENEYAPPTVPHGERQIAHEDIGAAEGGDTHTHIQGVQLRGAQLRRKRLAKYRCNHDNCAQTFTTAFRLKTHCNRFHTPLHLQTRYTCALCRVYGTTYAADLKRHWRSCLQRGTRMPLST